MSIKAVQLKTGTVVDYKDGLWSVEENEKVAKGKGDSFYMIRLRNLRTGQLIRERFRTVDTFEDVFIERKSLEYLYSDNDSHVLMDQETFEQVMLPKEFIGEQEVYLVPNIEVQVGFVEGQPITAELPNTVELEVTDTPPQVKGATATSQLKDATCDTGAKVKVPEFVENGTRIKVDTRTGEYLGRV